MSKKNCCRCTKDQLFLILAFIGIILGFIIGLSVRTTHVSDDALMWIGIPGELYLRLLKVTVMPAIVCGIIDGTASFDARSSGRVGLVTFGYILVTNTLGVILGALAFFIVRPGSGSELDHESTVDTRKLTTMDIFTDFVRNLIPDNIVEAAFQQSQTKYTPQDVVRQVNVSGELTNVTLNTFTKSLGKVPGTNLLGLVICCSALGFAASKSGDAGRHFINFARSMFVVVMRIFSWLKWTTPIGVASLIAHVLAGADNLGSSLGSLGMFMLTQCGANIIYAYMFLPLVYFVIIRKNPLTFLKSLIRPSIMGFGPPSSMAALPELLRVSSDIYKIDPSLAKFVFSFCVTLNRDGSILFITTSCFFIAQLAGVELEAGFFFTIIIVAIFTSLAIPIVPSSSVVSTLIILESLGVAPVNVGLILAMDWISDRVRTVANIHSHLLGTIITWRLCKKSFASSTNGLHHKAEDQHLFEQESHVDVV